MSQYSGLSHDLNVSDLMAGRSYVCPEYILDAILKYYMAVFGMSRHILVKIKMSNFQLKILK